MINMDKLNTPRELRGLEILSKGDTITTVKKNTWAVKSQTGIGEYQVYKKYNQYFCSCPDFEKRQMDCKHIFAVKFSMKLKADVETDYEEISVKVDDFKPASCPECKSHDIIKSGIRKTDFGEAQRYKCKSCGHRFTIDKGFSRMKNEPKAITLSMDLYFKGISYRKVCDHLKQFYGLEVSQTTPMRWVEKYLRILSEYVEQYKANVGNVWHSDEMTVFIKKEGEKRYYEWIWNLMDADTRYLLACRVTKSRFVDDSKKPLQDAKERAIKRPDAIVTDGLQAYQTAIPNEFYDKTASIRNPHIRLYDFETKPNNNILERLNGTFRERAKVMRGLYSDETAENFMDASRVYYNYLRPHMALDGKTPAEAAGINLNLKGNRWMKMIEQSVEHQKK